MMQGAGIIVRAKRLEGHFQSSFCFLYITEDILKWNAVTEQTAVRNTVSPFRVGSDWGHRAFIIVQLFNYLLCYRGVSVLTAVLRNQSSA